ncbi:hypothetical protein ACQKP8_20780 [Photobacterium alginatilyticum]|uniref:hypothetical protein n=1 Tax=Photobacterium alginatilyticum TaxID=1775171 RepID=UPI0040696AA0
MRKFIRVTIFAALGMVSLATQADENNYSMADLQKLAGDQSWAELVAHLDDIKPSSRNNAWLQLVDKAGVGFLAGLSKAASNQEAVSAGKVLGLRYPSLIDSREFTSLYLALAEEFYSDCYRYQSAECINEYSKTLEQFSAPASIAFQKGVLAFQQVSKTSSVPFFALAVKNDHSYCSAPELGQSVLETLALPKHLHFNSALQIATDACKEFKLDGADGYLKHSFEVQQALCENYIAEGFVKGVTKRVCQLVLDG